MTKTEIRRRRHQRWIELDYWAAFQEELDPRTVDEVREDLGDAEYHRRREEC